MTLVRVNLSISLDGYVAGPRQSLENPLGEGGTALHEWAFATRSFRGTHDMGDGGELGLDDVQAARWNENVGATVMGRNMFGPVRGEWPDDDWKGWWGDDPPYHGDVFVLTHHAREPVAMQGGTTFHFVTEGIEEALARARDAAGGRDVSVAGGADTVRQYLRAGLVDTMTLHVAPVLLGAGERLFDGLDLGAFRCTELVASPAVAHFTYDRAPV